MKRLNETQVNSMINSLSMMMLYEIVTPEQYRDIYNKMMIAGGYSSRLPQFTAPESPVKPSKIQSEG
jgi:hypothetical protein